MSKLEYYPFSNGDAITLASLKIHLEEQIKISETNMQNADREMHILLGPYSMYDELPDSIPEPHRRSIRFAQEEMFKSMGEMNAFKMLLDKINGE
jgi:hypothetical protein